MPSRPTLFDDDAAGDHDDIGIGHSTDDSRPVRAEDSRAVGADDSPPVRAEPPGHDALEPNYWFRRAVLIGGVVAVVAAAAVLVVNLRAGSTSNDTDGSIDAAWNRIVVTDARSGNVIVEDSDGEEVARSESGVQAITASRVVGPTSLVVAPDGAAIMDLSDESAETIEIEATTIAVPSGSALTMIAPSTDGSRAVLVHGPTGDRLDTAEFASIIGTRFEVDNSRSTPSGRSVLVTDSGNFQSVLLSFDRDEPSYFPGLALAIDDDIVVTGQNVGTEATVSIFDHDGDPIASGQTPSVRAAMVGDDAVQVVTAEGEVVSVSTVSGQTETVGQLDIGTIESGAVAANGDILIVVGSTGTALVGSDGRAIARFDAFAPVDATWATRSATCIVLTDPTTEDLVVAELTTGAVRAEISAAASSVASADGCTVAVPASPSGVQIVGGSDTVMVDTDGELVALTPDATAIVVDRDGRLVLVAVDDATDANDIGPSGRTVAFTEL